MNRKAIIKNLNSFTLIILKSTAQIMLQESAITGFLFLVGIFYGSVLMGFAAVLAIACSIFTAKIFNFNTAELNKGIYGFSAALVGAAVVLFLNLTLVSWLIIVIGAILATMLQHFFLIKKIPAFTFPFVLITWLILYFIKNYYPALIEEKSVLESITNNSFDIALKSFGQVIFQNNSVSGALFFIAVFLSSPIAALHGFVAAVIASIFAFLLFAPVAELNMGLYGFNAVLCAIVFAGAKIKDGVWVLVAVMFSLFISFVFTHYNLPQLTFPFVFASFSLVIAKKYLEKFI